MQSAYLRSWLEAYGLTVGLELALTWPLLARMLQKGRMAERWRIPAAVIAASTLSHPAVWFVWPQVVRPYFLMVVVAEAWAVTSEWVLYRLVFPELGWGRALVVSFLANALSFSVGWLLMYAT